jgi:hypothetical protein
MELRAVIWPKARKDYSMRTAFGRVTYVAMLIIGSLGVIVELIYWHGRWDHLAIYAAMWLAYAALGRLARLVLARE